MDTNEIKITEQPQHARHLRRAGIQRKVRCVEFDIPEAGRGDPAQGIVQPVGVITMEVGGNPNDFLL